MKGAFACEAENHLFLHEVGPNVPKKVILDSGMMLALPSGRLAVAGCVGDQALAR